MCNWKKWIWPGLITTAILTMLAGWLAGPNVEADLTAKASSVLQDGGHGWAKVALDGRDLTLSGTAPEPDAQSAAAGLVGNAYDVRVVKNISGVVPEQKPYTFSAALDDKSLILNGYIPNENTRGTLVDSAKKIAGSKSVTDNLKVARGAPAGFAAAAGFGISQLARLASGKASLNNNDYSIEGTATSGKNYAMANKRASGELTKGFKLASKKILAPAVSPYKWGAEIAGKTINLTGYVPNEEARAAIISSVGKSNPGKSINDAMRIAAGDPAGFVGAAGFGAALLPNLVTGKASISDSSYTVKGVAGSLAGYDKANNQLDKSLPKGYKIATRDISRATISPYNWSAKLAGDTITLSGYAPDGATRSAIAAAAGKSNPSAKIVNKMKIAAGAPAGFANTANYSAALLTNFTTGEANLADTNLSVTGQAKSIASYDNAISTLSSKLPTGYKIANQKIERSGVSPYTWNAEKKGNTITLGGHVPSANVQKALLDIAAKENPGAKIVDNMQIANGAGATYMPTAKYALARMGEFESGSASLSDSNFEINGQAKSVESYIATLKTVAAGIPDGASIQKSVISPASVTPYSLEMEKTDGLVTIKGYVPDERTRSVIKTEAEKANPGATIIDRTWVASGVPEGMAWDEAGRYAVSRLGELSKGKASILIDQFSIEGPASSAENYKISKGTITAGLAGGMKLSREAITLPVVDPYTWSITRKGANAKIIGYVPEQKLADTNVTTASRILGRNSKITDEQLLGGGAPRGLASVTSIGINAISRLEDSKASIVGTNLTVTGEALSQIAADTLTTQVERSLPPGFIGKATITVRAVKPEQIVPANVCQNIFNNELKFNSIFFEVSKANIKDESFGLLDRLVFAARRCPLSRISIEGHTDSDGAEAFNQNLSENRAKAIRDYLSKSGILGSRMDILGHGETKPVADNNTKEGKAKNRRIEFRVIQ